MNLEAMNIGGLGITTKCIGTLGITQVEEYVTCICTLWVVSFWGKKEVDEG